MKRAWGSTSRPRSVRPDHPPATEGVTSNGLGIHGGEAENWPVIIKGFLTGHLAIWTTSGRATCTPGVTGTSTCRSTKPGTRKPPGPSWVRDKLGHCTLDGPIGTDPPDPRGTRSPLFPAGSGSQKLTRCSKTGPSGQTFLATIFERSRSYLGGQHAGVNPVDRI